MYEGNSEPWGFISHIDVLEKCINQYRLANIKELWAYQTGIFEERRVLYLTNIGTYYKDITCYTIHIFNLLASFYAPKKAHTKATQCIKEIENIV